jgi:hypothetical protein
MDLVVFQYLYGGFDAKNIIWYLFCVKKICLAGEKRSDVPKEFNWSFHAKRYSVLPHSD